MAAVGVHTVTVTPTGGAAVDVSCWVLEADVVDGREDTASQPDAASCTLAIVANPDAGPLPGVLEVGAALSVTTTTTAASTRFAGTITDLALGWEDAPDGLVGQVIATGILADLGYRVVGDVPFPQELDGARVTRVMAAAGITLDPAFSDPGTVQILARDVDSQPALDVSQACAASASGIVWTTRGGLVRYADAEHRRGTVPALSLDACNITVTPTWRRTTEGLVNEVSVGYGVATEGGEQPRFTGTRADSIAKYGRRGYSITTELAAEPDATALGNMLLTRNSSPVWVMSTLPVDVGSLTTAEYEALLGLEMHSLVNLTGLPSAGAAPTTAVLWLEGRHEHLSYGVHQVELVVSGYCRTVPPPRWDDLSPTWTWDTLAATLTWDGAACVGPPVDIGRWDDQPATLRWDQVAPTATWDTYTGG